MVRGPVSEVRGMRVSRVLDGRSKVLPANELRSRLLAPVVVVGPSANVISGPAWSGEDDSFSGSASPRSERACFAFASFVPPGRLRAWLVRLASSHSDGAPSNSKEGE